MRSMLSAIIIIAALTGCAEKKLTVALVTQYDYLNTPYTQQAWAGVMAKTDRVIAQTVMSADLSEEIKKYDFIINLDLENSELIHKQVELYPKKQFVLFDEAPVSLRENAAYVTFRSEEAAALAGYAAAKTSATGKIGFVGGKEAPSVEAFERGFTQGAQLANPDIDVFVSYTGSFNDIELGRSAAKIMYDEGCDVVFACAGTTGEGVFEEAVERDRWVIGVDIDETFRAPRNTLTCVVKNCDKVIDLMIDDYLDGYKIGGRHYAMGLQTFAVGIIPNNGNISDALYDEIKMVEHKIVTGEIIIN